MVSLEEIRENSGLPGFIAGGATLIVGNALTQAIEPNYETIGYGLSGIAAIAMVGLVGEIRKRRRQNLSEMESASLS